MGIIEYLSNTNVFNFLIVVAILVFVCKKAKIGAAIQKTIDDIKESIEKSKTAIENATVDLKAAKEEAQKGLKQEEKILAQAEVNAQHIKEKIEHKTVLLQEEIVNGLERIYKNQSEKFKNLTLNDVYLASIDLAKEEIVKKLDDKMHRKLIDNSINELDKIKGSLS